MKRFIAILATFFILSSVAFSQNANNADDIDGDANQTQKKIKTFQLNEPGDQYIRIGLMMTMPLNFGGDFPLFRNGKISTGGAGMLGYHRFFSSWFAAGADIFFGYNPTIGSNMFTYVPLILNVTLQPSVRRFEFPITLGAGIALENYLNRTYFPGFAAKCQAGAFYRATPSWSFGIEGDFMYLPQWYDNSSHNDYGIFSSFVIAARYHF